MGIIPTPVLRRPATSAAARPLRPLNVRAGTAFELFRAAYPDFVRQLSHDRDYRKVQLGKIAGLTEAQRRSYVRKLLRDRKLHRLYAYDAMRATRSLRTATPDKVLDLATRFNAFAPVGNEPFAIRLARKGNGERMVHDFGLRRRMHQQLVADILRELHPPPRTQTLFNGGMPMARSAIAAAYREGLTFGVEVDFARFYDSVRSPALADLLRPLPTPVVDSVVWDFAMRDDPSIYAVVGTMPAPTSSVPTGLSLGSATSPIVAEKIVAELLARAGQPVTITYADNLFVMGRSHGEVEARINRIREIAASWPEIGTLELREGASFGYDLTQPFEFLKQQGVATESGLEWRPGILQQDRYRIGDGDHPLNAKQIAAAERRIRQWRRSYPDWPEGDVQEAVHLAEIAARRFYRDGNISNRSSAVHAVIVAWLADGQQRAWSEFLPDAGDDPRHRRVSLIAELDVWLDAALARVPAAA